MKGKITGFDSAFIDVAIEDAQKVLIARSHFRGTPKVDATVTVFERGRGVFYSPAHNKYLDNSFYVARTD